MMLFCMWGCGKRTVEPSVDGEMKIYLELLPKFGAKIRDQLGEVTHTSKHLSCKGKSPQSGCFAGMKQVVEVRSACFVWGVVTCEQLSWIP